MNLAIDVGNTRIKAGVFDGETLVKHKNFEISGDDLIADFVKPFDVQHVIVCSVNGDDIDIEVRIPEVSGLVVELSDQTNIPIVNGYDTPHTLGKDRLAAAVGGNHILRGNNVLIVDAGTCITYDLVTADGKYVGGNIAPGLNMRLKAMHDFTARLPLVKRGEPTRFMGRSTEEAIKNGAVKGILLEIEGYIGQLTDQYATLETVITGGDASYFADLMKTKIFVRSNLVLIGLNEILKLNVAELK